MVVVFHCHLFLGGSNLGGTFSITELSKKTSSWLNHPFETYAQVKLDHFPKNRGENKKMKPQLS